MPPTQGALTVMCMSKGANPLLRACVLPSGRPRTRPEKKSLGFNLSLSLALGLDLEIYPRKP